MTAEEFAGVLGEAGAREKAGLFDEYLSFLSERNKVVNLTAITEPDDVRLLHFYDSLTALPLIPRGATVLDIGSGAGFPGLPIAIVREDVSVTMIDSVRKKTDFIAEAIARLGLKNARAEHTRVEDIARGTEYDVILSRAVAPFNVLAEYALPFLKTGGRFIAYKSAAFCEEAELARHALDALNGFIEQVVPVKNFGLDRTLVVIGKSGSTPSGYPRKKNLPRTKPL